MPGLRCRRRVRRAVSRLPSPGARCFRWLHLAAIGIVVAEAWLGVACPLTTLEAWLRGLAGEGRYAGSFIGHWLQRLLYVDAPPEAFVAACSLFFLAVLLAWWKYPPRRRGG